MPTKKFDPGMVKAVFREIDASKKWREEKEKVWDRTIGYLKGEFFDDLEDEDKVCVNMVYPHVRVVIPAIYSRNPDIRVSPRRFDDRKSDIAYKRAECIQKVLRYEIKELGLKKEGKLCILDAILTGLAYIKVGYETKFELEQEEDDSFEEKNFIDKLFESMFKEEEEYKFTGNEKIVSERPWVLRTSPYDIFVPALSRRPEELRKIWERIIIPYEQVMDDDKYQNKDGLKPTCSGGDLLRTLKGYKDQGKRLEFGEDDKYCILYECWDGVDGDRFTICEGYNEVLEENNESVPTEFDYLDSGYHPYFTLRFNEVPDEYYPQNDIEPVEPQQLELNEIRTKFNKHIKRFNRRYAYKEGAFTAQSQTDLANGEDGAMIEIKGNYSDPSVSIDNVVKPIIDAPMPAEIYAQEKKVKDDIYNGLGTMDYASRGNNARTATEAQIMATQSRFRVEERIDEVGTFLEAVIRGLAQVCQKNMTARQVADILGIDAVFWEQVTDKDKLRGEFTYGITYGSTAPINKEAYAEKFMQWFMLTRNDPYYNQVMNRLELNRQFDLEDPEAWLAPQVIEVIERQRLAAAKMGMLLEPSSSPLVGFKGSMSMNGQGGAERLPTGQPRGLPGDRSGGSVPRGTEGGTDLAESNSY